MQPTDPSRIELDLDPREAALPPRRSRPAPEPASSLPRIEPALKDTDAGTDETERAVGLFLLASLLPDLVSLWKGNGGLAGLAIPAFLGVGLLRRDEFARQWVQWACLVQLVMVPFLLVGSPHAGWSLVAGLLRTGALLALVSGRAVSRRTYRLCVGTLGLGVLVGLGSALAR